MSQEDIVREIKIHNENLFKQWKEEQKNESKSSTDWTKNPILYVIITLFLSFVLNFVDNRINNDNDMLVVLTELKSDCKGSKEDINNLEVKYGELLSSDQDIRKVLNQLEKILAVIRTKLSISDVDVHNQDKKWEDLIREYESEQRGAKSKDQTNVKIYFPGLNEIMNNTQDMFFKHNCYMQK